MGVLNIINSLLSNASKKKWDLSTFYWYFANWKKNNVLPHTWEYPQEIYFPSQLWNLCKEMKYYSDKDRMRRALSIYYWGGDYAFSPIACSGNMLDYPSIEGTHRKYERTGRKFYYHKVLRYLDKELLRKEIYAPNLSSIDDTFAKVITISTHVVRSKTQPETPESLYYPSFSIKEIEGLLNYQASFFTACIVTDKLELLCKTKESKLMPENIYGDKTFSEIYKALNLVHYESTPSFSLLKRTELGV